MSERDRAIRDYMAAEQAIEKHPDRRAIKEWQIAKLALEDVERRHHEGPKRSKYRN